MADKKLGVGSSASRQAGYSARNKARLIKDAQEILADIGPSATIEQIATRAEVSPTTIYKYFKNKDELFIQALGDMWHGWVSWAFAQTSTKDDLEAVVEVARRLFRVNETHPDFARVLHNTLKEMPDFFIQADQETARKVFGILASKGQIKQEDLNYRFGLWTSMYSGLNTSVHVTGVLSPTDADHALAIALSIWGITPAKAKKMVSGDLKVSFLK